MYEDQGVNIKFTKLSNDLATSFPGEKLDIMKDIIIGIVSTLINLIS